MLELSNHDAYRSLLGLVASDEMQRQPAFNASYSAMDAMISSQGTNGIGSRFLQADNSVVGWTAHSEVQENNADKTEASKCWTFGTIIVQDCVWIEC